MHVATFDQLGIAEFLRSKKSFMSLQIKKKRMRFE